MSAFLCHGRVNSNHDVGVKDKNVRNVMLKLIQTIV